MHITNIMMKKSIPFSITILTIFILHSCASYKPQIRNDEDKNNVFPNKEVDRTFYLIGDAGLSPANGLSLSLNAFKSYIKNKETKNDYALFLGDNVYPEGMPKEDESYRSQAEHHMDAQFESVKGFKGKTIFIPGNHEWYADGVDGVKEEEKYVEAALGKDSFLPTNGCPMESIDVSETVQLIIIDTQWYLENWDYHPTMNDECEIKTRERMLLELEGEIKKAQGKTVVIAMHHPMFTNGVHGGYFALNKHLYPTQKDIPIPILSSLVTQIRTQGGISIQDRYNELYNNLMKRIETLATESGNITFVSGHEHTLQYIETEHIKQIVSGAGSKESYVALSDNGLFTYGKQGFAVYTVFKDGSSWVQYFSAEGGEPSLLFQKEVYPPTAHFDVSKLPDTFPREVEVSVYADEETDKKGFYETIWGERYRNIYSKKVRVPVATLDTLYGGLEIVRKGGGHQTRSLRLKTKDGRELNLRALRKSATQYLQAVVFKDTYVQDDFEQTEVENLILDFYTAAHPYAFLAIPDLSHAAKLYHTNPKLFFIPKHKYLGDFNTEYGGELYMIEERPEDDYTDERTFGYADDIESTHDIIEKIRKDEKYKIDENAYVRARLFDMLVGDWDRHQDQWRWAQFDQENGDKVYKPIPRDRDQVFSNFDGALLDVLKVITGATKQLQVYDAEAKDIKWMNSAGVKLDRVLIQKSEKDVWLKQAQFLQDNITDEVIETAFSKVPKEVQDSSLEDIKNKLKGRRSNIKDIAERYYDYLNSLVTITGTDKDDYFEITRIGDNETHVKVSRIKDGKKADVLLDRTFNKNITKEIWIYGLDDKDVFEVSGKAHNMIYTRIIGGQNNDTYIIKNGRRIKIYDHKTKKNTIEENKGAQIKLTDIYNLNLFDFQKTIVRTNLITPSIGYNPDDGIKIGIADTYTVKGFQRNPFSQQHTFNGGYFFATNGFDLKYNGEFANIFADYNLLVGGRFTSENFTRNFFGYGNETLNNDDELDLDYNRVKTSIYEAEVGVIKRSAFGSDYEFKAIVEGIELQNTSDRFITDLVPSTDEEFYSRKVFAALEGEYNYNSFDNKLNPSKGMTFLLNLGGKTNVDDIDDVYGYINSNLGFYNSLSKNKKLVLKTDLRTQFRFGSDFEFYQASNIGGNNGLRGYRTERFTGRNSLVGSADIRYSLPSFKTKLLPLQFGLFAGADVGRVWLRGDFSDKWHNDYGGGFWITAAETVEGTFNLFSGEDGLRFSFGFGVNF
ncbi:MAG: metallophosphoesterase [Gelidibacter sp.]